MNAPSQTTRPCSRLPMLAMTLGAALFGLLTFLLMFTLSVTASPSPIAQAQQRSAPDNPTVYINHTPLTATEDVTYTLVISTLDPNLPSGGIAVTMFQAPSWLWFKSFRGGAATFVGRPKNQDVGEHHISLQLQVGSGFTTTQKFTVTVLNTNDAPGFVTRPYAPAMLGQGYRYTIETQDPDVGDIFTLTVLSKPDWLTFTPISGQSGILTGMVTQTDIVTGPIILQVIDAAGLSARQVFSITVSTGPVTVGSVKGKVTSGKLGVEGVAVVETCHPVGQMVCLPVDSPPHETDAEGNFSFEHLVAGQHQFFFDVPAGYTAIEPIIASVEAGEVTILPDIIVTYQIFLPTLAP